MDTRDRNIEIYRRHAVAALKHYDLPAGAMPRLISLSENATFIVEGERPFGILRIYLTNAKRQASVRSELAWIEALRRDAAVDTPEVLPTRNGGSMACFAVDGTQRVCAMFEYVPGGELSDHDTQSYSVVGRIAAQLHQHGKNWKRPTGFVRRTWDLDTILGKDAEWGDWRAGPGLDLDSRILLERTEQRIRQRLGAYPVSADRGGLVHCDLRAANLMIDPDGRIWVIDFDDCGASWFLWDLCSSTTFIEHLPKVDDIVQAWLTGYQQIRQLAEEDIRAIPDLVMLRRLHIFAWLGSHPESDLTGALKHAYCAATCQVARQYLDERFLADIHRPGN
ncbi:MAG: phosphotransferase enzyme family protein [Rhizobiaceae bacterium]